MDCIFLLIITSIINGYRPQFQNALLEMFGLKPYVMCFCWYVSFYIMLMFIFPCYVKLLKIRNSYTWDISISIVFYLGIQLLIKEAEKMDKYNIILAVSIYLLVAIIGYLFAKYNVLNRMRDTIQNAFGFYSIVGFLLICSALVLHGMKSYIGGISIGIVVVPMLMEGIAFTKINLVKWFRKILLVLGKNSMNIWFLHCIFFQLQQESFFNLLHI